MSTNKTAKNDASSHKKKERTCRNGNSLSRHRRMNFASGTLVDIASPLQSYIDDRSHPRSTPIGTSREENHLFTCQVRGKRREKGRSEHKHDGRKKQCEFAQKKEHTGTLTLMQCSSSSRHFSFIMQLVRHDLSGIVLQSLSSSLSQLRNRQSL